MKLEHGPIGVPFGRREVPRDPISGAIALQTLLGSSALFTTEAAVIGLGALGAAGAFAAQAALSIGLSLAASALLPRGASSGAPVNSPESRYTTRQTTPPKRIIFGKEVYCGGALFFEKVKPPYLIQGFLICDGEIEGIDAIYIGTNKVPFASLDANKILTPLRQDGLPNYADRLRVSIGLGKDDQGVDPIIAANFSNIGPDFRQRGIARIVLQYDFGADQDEYISLWGNNAFPSAFWLARGVRVFDPRKPGSDESDKSTWTFDSNSNASIVQAHYMRALYGGRLKSGRIPLDRLKAAADYDDGILVTKNGDNLKQHTIDGLVTLDQSPADVMTGMLSANRGYLVQAGGLVWPTSSIPLSPVLTITDDILAGGIDYSAGKERRDQINSVKSRFIAKEEAYSLIDGPGVDRPDLVEADGEPLPGVLTLPFTMDHRRVQRLMDAFFKSARLERSASVSIKVRAMADATDELVGAAVRIESKLFPQSNGIYHCNELSFGQGFSTIQLALTEYDASIETSYNAATQEQDFEQTDLNLS